MRGKRVQLREATMWGLELLPTGAASAWRGACKRAGIAGASPHTLRHTWASWHYAMHRDLMRLKSDGDWSTVSQTERYTKLVPATMAPEIRKFLGLSKPSKRAAA